MLDHINLRVKRVLEGDLLSHRSHDLHASVNEGLRSQEMQASLRKLGADTKIMSPAEFSTFMLAEHRKWSEVARAASIKVE